MKASLLNKEVLVAYDIRQVQRYIFAGSSVEDTEGASNILLMIFNETFNYCVHHPSVNLKKNEYNFDDSDRGKIPYLYDCKIKMQVIFIGGGNAMVLYRTGRLAEKINRLFSSYILHKTYSLEVAIAVVEKTDNFELDNINLYNELDHAKNNGAISLPMPGLAISSIEPSSGFQNTFFDKKTGEYHSTVSKIKRERLFNSSDATDLLPWAYINDSSRVFLYDKIRKNNSILAFIKIDGNSMGMRISQIKRGITDYQKGIIVSRKIQRNIQSAQRTVIDRTIRWFMKLLIKRKERKPSLANHFLRGHCGGDDINIVCDYHYAFSIAEYLVRQFENLYLWKDKRLTIPFSVCVGVAFCSNKITDFIGHSLADECCQIAKSEAKKKNNKINGYEKSWIYFQDCKSIQNYNFKKNLDQDFILSDGKNLCLKPYCLSNDLKGDLRHFSTFKEYYHLLEKANFKKDIIYYLQRAYHKSEFYIDTSLATLKEVGVNFPQQLIKTFSKVKNRPYKSALWYDALEIAGYFYDAYEDE